MTIEKPRSGDLGYRSVKQTITKHLKSRAASQPANNNLHSIAHEFAWVHKGKHIFWIYKTKRENFQKKIYSIL